MPSERNLAACAAVGERRSPPRHPRPASPGTARRSRSVSTGSRMSPSSMMGVGRAKRIDELLADAVVEVGLAGREAAVDAHGAADQTAGGDRAADDVEEAAFAERQVRRLEAERDLVDRAGEEEREQPERQRARRRSRCPPRRPGRPRARCASRRPPTPSCARAASSPATGPAGRARSTRAGS